MIASNANQELRSKDLGWYLLGEYPLSKFLPDPEKGEKVAIGLVSQTMKELGISPEYVENIEVMLTEFANEALEYFKGERLELPGRIRIFCQKKMIDEEMKGGLGCFLIERGDNVSTGSSVSSQNSIDLYLYKEGE